MSAKTRAQKQALAAYEAVQKHQDSLVESAYRTLALRFASMIMQSGLTHALGFALAKNRPEHQAYLQDLMVVFNHQGLKDAKNLHEEVLRLSCSDYQLYTRLLLDAAVALKRYAEALLQAQGADHE